jgi:ABC-type transport system involved in cytochrome bd biosynthesis fused ATPase/permease subunit
VKRELCDDRGLLVITHDATALEEFDRVLSL